MHHLSRTEYWGCRRRWLLVQFLVEKQFHWTVMSSKQLQPICIGDKSLVLSGPESQGWYLAAGGLFHWIILSRNPESQTCNSVPKISIQRKASLDSESLWHFSCSMKIIYYDKYLVTMPFAIWMQKTASYFPFVLFSDRKQDNGENSSSC